jgi:hypothetical protein
VAETDQGDRRKPRPASAAKAPGIRQLTCPFEVNNRFRPVDRLTAFAICSGHPPLRQLPPLDHFRVQRHGVKHDHSAAKVRPTLKLNQPKTRNPAHMHIDVCGNRLNVSAYAIADHHKVEPAGEQ